MPLPDELVGKSCMFYGAGICLHRFCFMGGIVMKERMIQLLSADTSFTEDKDIAMYEFGLSRDKHYDVLVVAPG